MHASWHGILGKVIQQKDGEKDFALSAAYTWLVQHYGQVNVERLGRFRGEYQEEWILLLSYVLVQFVWLLYGRGIVKLGHAIAIYITTMRSNVHHYAKKSTRYHATSLLADSLLDFNHSRIFTREVEVKLCAPISPPEQSYASLLAIASSLFPLGRDFPAAAWESHLGKHKRIEHCDPLLLAVTSLLATFGRGLRATARAYTLSSSLLPVYPSLLAEVSGATQWLEAPRKFLR